MKNFNEEELNYSLELFYQNDYCRSYFDKENGTGVCVTTAEYIPIRVFKELFSKNKEMIRAYGLKYFIFDKRALTTFDQASMEWYFTEWKKEVLDLGVKEHYKILPDLDWFKHSVEAGRAMIETKYDTSFLKNVRITYCNSVADCYLNIASNVGLSAN